MSDTALNTPQQSSNTDILKTLPKFPLPSWLTAAEYWFSPKTFIDRCSSSGDRFLLSLPGFPPIMALSSPEDIRTVFTGDQTALYLGKIIERLGPHPVVLGPKSISLKDGPEHLEDRRVQGPEFTRRAAKKYDPIFVSRTQEAMSLWPIGKPFNFHKAMMSLTLDIIIDVVMGVTNPDRAAKLKSAVLDIVKEISTVRFNVQSVVAMMKGGLWDGDYSRIFGVNDKVDALLFEEMTERRADTGSQRDDVLAIFLRLQKENPEEYDDEYIFVALRTLLLGGYETTAATLAWAGERLSRHPDVVKALEEDIDAGNSEYTEAVVNETLRTRPVVMFTGRMVEKEFRLDESTNLQPGMFLMPLIPVLHNREDVYPNAEQFNPERFIGEKSNPYQLIPFGGGVRKCLGAPFAVAEMITIIRTICSEFHIEATNKPDEKFQRRHVTIVPKNGGQLVLTKRH